LYPLETAKTRKETRQFIIDLLIKPE